MQQNAYIDKKGQYEILTLEHEIEKELDYFLIARLITDLPAKSV